MTTNTSAPTIRVVRLSDVAPAEIPVPPSGTPRLTFAELAGSATGAAGRW